jgi:drug/metabolite transporter (DMT)-like permease
LDVATVGIMLFAGLLHASWHSLVKSGANQITTLAGMGIIAGALTAVTLPFVPFPPLSVWAIIIPSVALHIGYKFCLARAYVLGDLGQAFPLARGMVPLFAATIAWFLLRQVPSALQMCGIALVSSGIIAIALDRIGNVPRRSLLAAAAGAGMAVAGYSVCDAYGTRLMGNWLAFTVWLVTVDSLLFLALAALVRGNVLWTDLAMARWRVVASGLLGLASFSVLLWALSRNPVGGVTALRETSVLFAGIIGVLLHKERLNSQRVIGALLIVAGIGAIAL